VNDPDMQILLRHISDLREEIEAIKRALASLRISTGHTGNQWFTLPPPPVKGEGEEDGQRELDDCGRGVVA
jgi:hypothetical protein